MWITTKLSIFDWTKKVPRTCVNQFSSVTQSCPTLCNPINRRPPCPPPTPRFYPNSCPLSRWCHPAICSPLLLLPPIPPSIRVFSNESTLRMRWPKYWSFSFSISPSNEYLGLISFRGSPCSPRDSQESSPTPQFKSINSSALSFLHSLTLTSIHDHWKNHSLDSQTFVEKVMSLFFNMLSRLVNFPSKE